ncbi:MAG: RDD family protein [Acidobacteria bacterium]|nr:RDD family protein [Acidobacteriota bacterium]
MTENTQPVPPPAPPQSAETPPPPPPPVSAPTPESGKKADVGKRFLAALIDGILAFVIGLIPFIGGLIGAAYLLVRDGMDLDFMDRRSLGKKIMKLRPIRLDGQPMDLETSLKRNFVFALGPVAEVFVFIPILGWAIAILLGVAAVILIVIEIVLVVSDAEGRRLGDKVGGTKVIEVIE